jgi:hypothetical protein
MGLGGSLVSAPAATLGSAGAGAGAAGAASSITPWGAAAAIGGNLIGHAMAKNGDEKIGKQVSGAATGAGIGAIGGPIGMGIGAAIGNELSRDEKLFSKKYIKNAMTGKHLRDDVTGLAKATWNLFT